MGKFKNKALLFASNKETTHINYLCCFFVDCIVSGIFNSVQVGVILNLLRSYNERYTSRTALS